MALDTRTKRPALPAPRRPLPVALWKSTIGKKVVMAVTGVIMIGYLLLHMIGNLKIFSGAEKFNSYSHWLRVIGEPVLPYEGFLWILRVVLVVSVVAHFIAAVQLSRRAIQGRVAVKSRKRLGGNYVAFSMRSGGIVLALFIVWHILDLTTLTVNRRAQAGHPYENLVATFSFWYGDAVYILALLALGFHLWHGCYAAAQTLGLGTVRRERAVTVFGAVVAAVITVGFLAAPIAVMTGVVS
jgi:succinate dehydrogenase / fumarate reductase cytochrome b subunit